jgi:ubiquinone/menaquinone biosynthesis C-methylase UbiE
MRSLDKVADTYQSLAEGYDKSYSLEHQSPQSRMFLRMYEHLTWRYLEPYLPDDRSLSILDAGGGTGKWAIRIAELGFRDVRILDLSDAMLTKARKRFADKKLDGVLTAQQGDIRELPWPDATFGLVLSEADAVGYCLDEWETALRELVRVCKPGGVVIVSADDLLAW